MFRSDKSDYEYVVSEFLRINGVYWSLTAMHVMGEEDRLDRDEVRKGVEWEMEAGKGTFLGFGGGKVKILWKTHHGAPVLSMVVRSIRTRM